MKVIHRFLMTVSAVLALMLLAQSGHAQDAAKAPTYHDTGNATADQARYDQEKKAWIAAHPEEYKALNVNANAPAKQDLPPAGVQMEQAPRSTTPTNGAVYDAQRWPKRERTSAPAEAPVPNSQK